MGSIERRSEIDSRSESEKQIAGERRPDIERRSRLASKGVMPSNEQLALFARRLKRAMRDEKGRPFLALHLAKTSSHFTQKSFVSSIGLSTPQAQKQNRGRNQQNQRCERPS
jgi:hypothetical protein